MLTTIQSTSMIFLSRLEKFKTTFPRLVDSVRGRGLILGIQLKSVGNKTCSDIAGLMITKARQKGLLIITAGEGTIRLVPPLNIPQESVSNGLAILEETMHDVNKEI